MADAVYAIEDFPDDDLLWRIEWIGGVGYNTSVPSDPQIEICLAQLPAGETNPLSVRSLLLFQSDQNDVKNLDERLFFPISLGLLLLLSGVSSGQVRGVS